MNIDYEKLGEALDKFVLNWPHGGTHDDHMVCCEVAAKRVIAASGLLEEVERLRAALREYGNHQWDCDKVLLGHNQPCSCGLTKALKGPQ